MLHERTLLPIKRGYILSALLLCGCGIILMVRPAVSLTLICRLLGATLVILGLVKGIGYFSKDKYHLAFQFDFALGLLSVLSGLLFIFRAEALLSLLPIMMGLIILIDSLFKLQTAFDAKRFGLHTWGGLLVSSILLAVFGLILLLEPFKSLTAAISLLGFTLVLDGLQHILLAVYTIKISKTKSK